MGNCLVKSEYPNNEKLNDSFQWDDYKEYKEDTKDNSRDEFQSPSSLQNIQYSYWKKNALVREIQNARIHPDIDQNLQNSTLMKKRQLQMKMVC